MKFLWTCATLFFLGVLLSGACAAGGSSRIEAALTRGDGPAAEELTRAALAKNLAPLEKVRLLVDLGLARTLQGAHDDALAIFTQAIDSRILPPTEQARALFERGVTLDALNRSYDAVGDYSVALSLAPGLMQARRNRADAYLRLNRFDLARQDYLVVLNAGDPRPADCYYGLGQIAEVEGDKPAAQRYYAKAIAADPVYADAVAWLTAPDHGALGLHPPGAVVGAPTTDRLVLKPPPPGHKSVARIAMASERKSDSRLGLRPAIDSGSQGEIQLGAWRSAAAATEGWNHVVQRAGGDLAGFSPHILVVDLPDRGRYYRLRIGTATSAGAARLCSRLHARKIDCVPVHD